MMNALSWLRECVRALPLAGIIALGAGPAWAAEYEVRMPVERTARLAPLGDAPESKPAAKPEAKPEASKAAPKTALGRAAEAAAQAAVPAKINSPAPAAAPPAPKAAKPVAATQAKKNAKPVDVGSHALSADPDAAGEALVTHVPSGPPIPVPVPGAPASAPVATPAKAPKPAPVVVVDPKARIMPPAPAGTPVSTPLPGDGQWVGDVDVEFRTDSIVLRAATNGAVERVTWFNLADPGAPRKLAVDLRGTWRKKGGAVVRFDTGPVKNVVVGEHPDRLRLAVEFRDGAVAPVLEPKLETGPKGVSLTIPLAVRLAP